MAAYGELARAMVDDYFTGATLKAMVMDQSYVPDLDLDHHVDDVSGFEIVVSGYTAGGVVLTGVVVTYDSVEQAVSISCDDIDFGTFADDTYVLGPLYYLDTGTPSTSTLIGLDDSSPLRVPSGDSYGFSPAAYGGIVTFQIALPEDL